MGIKGFLPLFKQVQEEVHIREYGGVKVAIDGNVWLHKGAFSCAYDLATNRPTRRYVEYFIRQVDMLLYHKVIPIIVFDGKPLPIKSHTNDQRSKDRINAREAGYELKRQGNTRAATEQFQKAISITPEMIAQVSKALAIRKVQTIVAPYEADSQLAYLIKHNIVEAIITEDSDLLVFGCKTVLFKMDRSGTAMRLRQKDLPLTTEINISGWDIDKIRRMCILSGCDYLESLPGIGIKRAHNYLVNFKTYEAVLARLRIEGKMKDTKNYEELFEKAEKAFLYQHVYDPITKEFVTLNPLPDNIPIETLDFLGIPPQKTSYSKETKDCQTTLQKHALSDEIHSQSTPELLRTNSLASLSDEVFSQESLLPGTPPDISSQTSTNITPKENIKSLFISIKNKQEKETTTTLSEADTFERKRNLSIHEKNSFSKQFATKKNKLTTHKPNQLTAVDLCNLFTFASQKRQANTKGKQKILSNNVSDSISTKSTPTSTQRSFFDFTQKSNSR
ncbi:PIN domain-like protein [Phycomyces blakesleeanus]|uniref:Exonuclease 1 n=2 Tax=Phycomyces blakesleeanus TaxID=4837 RepID=A0ABR3BIV7_PHYBL